MRKINGLLMALKDQALGSSQLKAKKKVTRFLKLSVDVNKENRASIHHKCQMQIPPDRLNLTSLRWIANNMSSSVNWITCWGTPNFLERFFLRNAASCRSISISANLFESLLRQSVWVLIWCFQFGDLVQNWLDAVYTTSFKYNIKNAFF